MTTSTHNPHLPGNPPPRPAQKRIIRKPAPPGGRAFNVLIHGDDSQRFLPIQNIDGNARQYLAAHKLFSDSACRAFRRTNQSHKTILQAARLGKR